MENKTAMQQMYDYLDGFPKSELPQKLLLMLKVKRLLEEEKKQIIQAASCGYFEAREGQHDPAIINSLTK